MAEPYEINTGAMLAGRIDRVLRSWGIAPRKEIRKWITLGRLTVDGEVLTDPNFYIEEGTAPELRLDGELLAPLPYLTVMMNKPAGYICVSRDDRYPTVNTLLADREPDRALFPVGRLDTDTEGLLLLTTDGMLGSRIARPEHEITKTYYFTCSRPLPENAAEYLATGITVANGEVFRPARLRVLGPQEGEITVTEGRYHEVKRLIRACGPQITYLKRIAIGALQLDEALQPGTYRQLSPEELSLIFLPPAE